jgi:hypothetical protein
MAPYVVSIDDVSGSFRFITDFGVEITIDFMEDDLLTSEESYQIILANANRKRSSRDEKLKTTILAIVIQFLEENQSAVLYLCETSDGKQKARERLFKSWINSYDYARHFVFLSTSITAEGIENAAALIIRTDNPKLKLVIDEFIEVTDLLRRKP